MKLSVVTAATLAITFTATILLSISAYAGDKETKLYNFQSGMGGADVAGFYPHGQLVADKAGNLYGATQSGGLDNQGAIFQLAPKGSGAWTLNVIYTCATTQVCSDSGGSLIIDGAGNLWWPRLLNSLP